jgi:hypothetical protein
MLAAIYFLAIVLLAHEAVAQTTEPLQVVTPVPSGPTVPPAPGQLTTPNETVAGRARPEYDPIGLRTGSFFWFPRGEVDEAYNSNIFAISAPTTADAITVLQPGLDVLSNFGRNALDFHGSAAAQFYALNPTQNTQSGNLAVDGRWDITQGNQLYGTVSAVHTFIPRTSPNSPGNAAEPVTYNAYTASGGYARTGLRFGYQADVAVQNTQYNAVPAFGGGILPQSSADNTITQAALRASYELIPDYLGYARISGNVTDYMHSAPNGVINDSTGYRADLGLQILPRHLLSGEVYAGYLNQMYHIGRNISGLDAGGRLTYNVTRLTTLTLAGARTIVPGNPTVTLNTSAYLASTATATVDHELLRNLILSGSLSYENDEYVSPAQTDNIFSVGAGVKYLMTRRLYLGANYTYQQRASPTTSLQYEQSIVMVRVSTQF